MAVKLKGEIEATNPSNDRYLKNKKKHHYSYHLLPSISPFNFTENLVNEIVGDNSGITRFPDHTVAQHGWSVSQVSSDGGKIKG